MRTWTARTSKYAAAQFALVDMFVALVFTVHIIHLIYALQRDRTTGPNHDTSTEQQSYRIDSRGDLRT
ncbi:hypothetical protein BC834DRAFT_869920 [Gloeopeniophorella convolvens]|nr:hypothetical protein BC834DRAFT_869920 [Gloeopeniophorella convolvens]